ncbi:MAG: glycoside hydrolase family 127 protein [Clostridia bacterium]|nr:glycoside hydrolase family 127 protein [Clostridia bacterium]
MCKEIYTHDLTNAKYNGFIDDAFNFIEDFQLLSPEHWRRFVEQFRVNSDTNRGWKGEYWGKMMRGASLVYSYTQNPELYDVLATTVKDMIESAEESGRISTYPVDKEFDGWDLWCRKYVLLGMQYFLDICKDDALRSRAIASMRGQLDYIIDHIGDKADGKKEINKATRNWRGLNSSSILEPVVRLYNLTDEKKYFDFATYIVERGCTDIVNIFDLAYKKELYPYQYPITEGYEMMSCFEGLIEYYKITQNEKYKQAIVNFADMVLESDFTVIGCSGCTHELFDHSSVRQANTTNNPIMQETCVTVTLMKFLYRVYLLTGDTKYVDAFEISFYNAYLGAINTEKVIEPTVCEEHPDWILEPLPFDSYSPLTAGTRGRKIGGLQLMPDMHYYGCCACIGSAGLGLLPMIQICSSADGVALNMFIDGLASAKTPRGRDLTINTDTAYPRNANVALTLNLEASEYFALRIRDPYWSKTTTVQMDAKNVGVREGGYIVIEREWHDGDGITIELDMRIEAIRPISYGTQVLMNEINWDADHMIPTFDREDVLACKHIAFRRGPIMLAQENRLGYSVDTPVTFEVGDDGYIEEYKCELEIPYNSILKLDLPTDSGRMTLTDYASAGKLWTDRSKMAVWMLIK